MPGGLDERKDSLLQVTGGEGEDFTGLMDETAVSCTKQKMRGFPGGGSGSSFCGYSIRKVVDFSKNLVTVVDSILNLIISNWSINSRKYLG